MDDVAYIKNIVQKNLTILDFEITAGGMNPLGVKGISDSRSFILPELIQKSAQAFNLETFEPRVGKFKEKWELFRNYEMFYKKICEKLKLDGWGAVVSSDQCTKVPLREIAIFDAADKMELHKCNGNGEECMPCRNYVQQLDTVCSK